MCSSNLNLSTTIIWWTSATESFERFERDFGIKTLPARFLFIVFDVRGTTIVVATHAKDIVDQMKKRVIEIEKGVIVRDDRKGGYSKWNIM